MDASGDAAPMERDMVDARAVFPSVRLQVDTQGPLAGNRGKPTPPKVQPLMTEEEFDAPEYKMSHPRRGVAIIFDIQKFEQSLGLRDRSDTDRDVENLRQVLTDMGFTVRPVEKACTAADMENILVQASMDDYSDADCFVCVILSHGDEGYVFGKDQRIEIDKLMDPFKGHNCKSLASKPKLFFIETCRCSDNKKEGTDDIGERTVKMRRIPKEADFFMACLVVPGNISQRGSLEGSWLIDPLCQVLRDNWPRMDLLTMMKKVNRKVAAKMEASSVSPTMVRQISCVTSKLTKDLYFTPRTGVQNVRQTKRGIKEPSEPEGRERGGLFRRLRRRLTIRRTPKDPDSYAFTHKKHGRAIIISNEEFDHPDDNRPGADCDKDMLDEMFKHLGFDVKVHENLTAVEMKKALEEEAVQYKHRKADCLAVAVLSHGDQEYVDSQQQSQPDKVRQDIIYGRDGSSIATADIIRIFHDNQCPGLRGKPRFFFFQACRGNNYDYGTDVRVSIAGGASNGTDHYNDGRVDYTDHLPSSQQREVPVTSPAPLMKDFLVMYATPPGYFAFRRDTGTWLVQSLHKVIMEQLTRNMTLTEALTRVIRMVAHGYQAHTLEKQTPVLELMLTKDVYFKQKKKK